MGKYRIALTVAGVAVGCSLAFPGVADAAEERFQQFAIPAEESGPMAIACGPDGNLWFTEHSVNRIGRMTPDGEFVEFPIPTPDAAPTGIAAGPDGNLWFTETSAGRIGRISTAGAVTEFPLPSARSEPTGIAAGPDGNVWFTETSGDAIGRIATSGQIVEFPLPHEVSRPAAIAAGPDGNLWFTEEQGSRIGRITPTGQITEFPVSTQSGLQGGIAAGPDGNLWFTKGEGIGRITPTGQIAEFPSGVAGFKNTGGIATGPDGSLWFTEMTTNTISRITTGGTVTEFRIPQSLPEAAAPTGISSGPGRYLWFTERLAGKIGRLDPGGPIPEDLKPPSITGTAKPGLKLTGHPGVWVNSPSRYSFLWQDCNRSGGACTEVTRGHRYQVRARDIGHTIRVFVIGRNLGGSSNSAESAPTPLVRGPAERLFLGGSVHQLSLMGSNGYRVSLSTDINHKYSRITLEAEKSGLYARYSVRGAAHNGTIRAIYPGLGRVAVHFVPTGVQEIAPHPGCTKPSGAIESGTYIGVIRFRGERKFTEVEASRAHGSIFKHFRQRCRVATQSATTSHRVQPQPFEEVDLSAKVGAVRFTASHTVGKRDSGFNVTASELRRGIRIIRGIPEVISKGAFTYDGPITEATAAPPLPFRGRARYSGTGDPKSPMPGFFTQGSLLGSLRVFLPGLGIVQLAKSGTTARMGRSAGVSE